MGKIRIQDDLFASVNEEWLQTAVIPDDKYAISAFHELIDSVEKQLMEDFAPLRDGEAVVPKELEEFIKFYKLASDFEKRNREGFNPVRSKLEEIENLASFDDWAGNFEQWILDGHETPLHVQINEDYKDTNRKTLWFSSPGTILPDNSYYGDEKAEERERLLGIWREMYTKLLSIYGKTDGEAADLIDQALAFDRLVAPFTLTSEENNQVESYFNPVSFKEVKESYSTLPLSSTFEHLTGKALKDDEQVVIVEKKYAENFASIVNAKNFELLKSYMFIKEVGGTTSLLSEEIRIIGGEFSRAITGVDEPRPQAKHVFDISTEMYSQVVGLYYGHKYFGEKAKEDVRRMVKSVIKVYKDRLLKNDWLSKDTIEKAVIKLDHLGIFVGYPDKLEEVFLEFVVNEEETLIENGIRFNKIRRQKDWAEYQLPVNRDKWYMPAHQVNAYFSPTANHIVFPAAILQAPMYSVEQTASQNFGGIGAIIAHEISHAFDNNGAQFDEFGNLKSWWKESDYEAFKEKQELMIQEFDGLETEAGVANGKLTVSENIADVGGVKAALSATALEPDANFEEFWKNWAVIWRTKQKKEYQKMLLSVDPHAPAILRANIQPQNFEEFHQTFGTKPGDKMWREPKDRVIIW
ncbi:MAG: peptidase M13 [Streptococcaceae bacterium]|jgi:putative endopeptidase|nr:peptidase M13 [Streptococcaceae bacterium]